MSAEVPAYPIRRPDRGADDRFTIGLTIDIATVLARHGFPPITTGADLLRGGLEVLGDSADASGWAASRSSDPRRRGAAPPWRRFTLDVFTVDETAGMVNPNGSSGTSPLAVRRPAARPAAAAPAIRHLDCRPQSIRAAASHARRYRYSLGRSDSARKHQAENECGGASAEC
jgi:hypothetical protein